MNQSGTQSCTRDSDCLSWRPNHVCSVQKQECVCSPWYGWGGQSCMEVTAAGPIFLIVVWSVVVVSSIMGMWFGLWDFTRARHAFQKTVKTSRRLNAAMTTTLNAVIALALIAIWGAFSLASVLQVSGFDVDVAADSIQAASSLGRFEMVTIFVAPIAMVVAATSLMRTALMWIEIAARSKSMRPVVGASFRRTNKLLVLFQILMLGLISACWTISFTFVTEHHQVSVRLVASLASIPLTFVVLAAFCVGSFRLTRILVTAKESVASGGEGVPGGSSDTYRRRGSGGGFFFLRRTRLSRSSKDEDDTTPTGLVSGGKRNSMETSTSGLEGGKRGSIGTPGGVGKKRDSLENPPTRNGLSGEQLDLDRREGSDLPSRPLEDNLWVTTSPVLSPPMSEANSMLVSQQSVMIRQGGSDLPPPRQYQGGNAMRASRWRRHAAVVQRTNVLVSIALLFGLAVMVVFSVLDLLYGWRDAPRTSTGISIEVILWMIAPCMLASTQIIIIGYIHFASSRSKTSSDSRSKASVTARRPTFLWGSYSSMTGRRSRQGSLIAFEQAEVANPAFGTGNPYLKKTLSHIREEPSPSNFSQAVVQEASPRHEAQVGVLVATEGMPLRKTRSFQNSSRATSVSGPDDRTKAHDVGGSESDTKDGIDATLGNIVI